eukprot:gene3928-6080_t
MAKFVGALLACASLVSAQPPATRFEVKKLVGLPGDLPSKMYSGFVDVGTPDFGVGSMYMHYVMFESENDPANAPTVFWYNGGPGASSMFGVFTELGPLLLNEDSLKTPEFEKTGIPTPLYNPHTWTKKFNVFALDSPAPVGFSYCSKEGPSGGGDSCGSWNDTAVFQRNAIAVKTLMNDIFPEYKKNELFITGESYAGVYIPGIVNELLRDIKTSGLNLKGYAIGDGCMGNEVVCWGLDTSPFTYPGTWPGPYYDILFFGGHGQISNKLYNQIRSQCPDRDLMFWNTTSPDCQALVHKMTTQLGGYFVYNLYDNCNNTDLMRDGLHKTRSNMRRLNRNLKGATNEYACSGNAMAMWFAAPGVLESMNLATNSNFFNADDGRGFTYTPNVADVRPFHAAAIKAGLRVLTYEGDTDASGLGSIGIQDIYVDFWPSIGLNRTQSWRPWTVDGQQYMGGYAMEWAGGQAAHLTVRGSGHM